MEEDKQKQIRSLTFQGFVPVRFEVPNAPVPLCFNVPRCLSLGYFTYLKFTRYIDIECKELWFTCDKVVLKWNLPIGVLYDALIPKSQTPEIMNITLHNTEFPINQVLRCENIDSAISYFTHSFKESSFVMNENMEFFQRDTKITSRLIDAVISNNFDDYDKDFAKRLEDMAEWKMWPVVIVKKDLTVLKSLLPVEPNQTVQSALQNKNVEAETVMIQGISINSNVPLAELFPLLMNPDGFLYICAE